MSAGCLRCHPRKRKPGLSNTNWSEREYTTLGFCGNLARHHIGTDGEYCHPNMTPKAAQAISSSAMKGQSERAVSHDGDIVRIDGKPLRMEFMVRDAFWAGDRAVVLLDPNAFLDEPGGGRKAPRDAVRNLRA